jgi:hypothetical protein
MRGARFYGQNPVFVNFPDCRQSLPTEQLLLKRAVAFPAIVCDALLLPDGGQQKRDTIATATDAA